MSLWCEVMWCDPPHCIMGNFWEHVGESDGTARALHESLIMFQSRTCGPTTHRLKRRASALSSSFSELCLCFALSYGSWGKSGTAGLSRAVRMPQLYGLLITLLFVEVSNTAFYYFFKLTVFLFYLDLVYKNVSFVPNFDVFFIYNSHFVVLHLLHQSLWHKFLTIFSTHIHTVHVAHCIVYCSCPGLRQEALCSLFSMISDVVFNCHKKTPYVIGYNGAKGPLKKINVLFTAP